MACRNIEKATIIRDELFDKTHNNNIFVMKLDLSSIQSINSFVTEFRQTYDRLDILLCNAGIWNEKNSMTNDDGIELTFAVNHLGHFHLAVSLRDIMERNPDNQYSRLIVVSSIMHRAFSEIGCCGKTFAEFNTFDIDKVGNGYTESTEAYSFSKLCNIMFVKEWSKRYRFKENSNIIAVCLHPGFGMTNLSIFGSNSNDDQDMNCCMKCGYNCIVNVILDRPQQLAYTQCYCAVTDIDNLRAGGYYRSKRTRSVVSIAMNDEYCGQLWEKSVELIHSIESEV